MLLERESDLDLIDGLVEDLDTSGGKVVLIRGEAGIGKSSLVAEVMDRHRDDCFVVLGACDDLLTPQALGPFWDIARDDASVSGALTSGSRREVHDRVMDLLARQLRRTLMIIEDTQWADEATLDVITWVGRRISRTNGVLILTYRDGEVDADHPLRQVIGDLPADHLRRIHLEPLTREAVATMIGDRPLDLDDVLALTDGNPLFVTEVLASGSKRVPSSIEDIVLARAARLSSEARALLELVSVLPGETDIALIEEILGPCADAVAECHRAGLLRTRGSAVMFTHELQRRAVESSLDPARRRALNQTALEALAHAGDPALLAHHASEAGDSSAIIAYAPAAGRAAISTGATRQAVRHFRLVEPYLELIEPADAASILEDWAQQEYRLDDPASLELIARCVAIRRTLGDDVALAIALTLRSRIEMATLRTEAALDHAREAVDLLERLPPGPPLADALCALAYVHWLYHENVPEALEIVARALAIAEEVDDDGLLSLALRMKGVMEYSIGVPGGMALLESARARAERSRSYFDEVAALCSMTSMAADVRDVAIAADLARRAIEGAVRYELRTLENEARATYAEILMWQGDWEGAESAAFDCLDAQTGAATIAWRVLATMHARSGRAEARLALDRMWDIAGASEQLTILDPAATSLAEYLWLTGKREPAWEARLEEILAFGIAVGPPWPSGAFAFWMWKLERFDPSHPVADFYGSIITGAASQAAEFWRQRDIPYEEALALMHGDTNDQLEAVRILDQLGADACAARVRRSLSDAGVRVSRGLARTTMDHAAGLTARQAEVLELLAERLSNIDIADRLFISNRTVENHVAAILMKLDAPTRETAVETAVARGLLVAGGAADITSG